MKCTIAGFLNDDLLNLCDFLRWEKYKKVEISNHTKEILYPPPTYTKVKFSKSKFSKDQLLNNRMILWNLRQRVHSIE